MRPSNPTESQDSPFKNMKKKWRQRHRVLWVLCWLFGSIIGLLTLAIIGIVIFVNTQKGQDYLANKIGDLTEHSVEVSGLSGEFPNHLRVRLIKLKDPKIGTWLEVKQVRLDWSWLALLTKKVSVDTLSAKELNLYALPPSDETAPAPPTPPNASHMLLSAVIRQVHVDKFFISHGVAPVDLSIGIDGQVDIHDVLQLASFQSWKDFSNTHVKLHVWELNQATDIQLQSDWDNHQVKDTSLKLRVRKQSDGIVERLLKTDQFSPLSLDVSLQGPFDKIKTDVELAANQLKLSAKGDVDALNSKLDLQFVGNSPAMNLNSNLGWGGWKLNLGVVGNMRTPAAVGSFVLNNVVAGNAMANLIKIDFTGKDIASVQDIKTQDSPLIYMNARAEGVRIPGAYPNLLAGSPVVLDMTYRPKDKDQPVDFKLSHLIIQATGRIFVKPALHGNIDLTLPNLGPFASMGNVNIQGSTNLAIGFALSADPKNPIKLDIDGPLVISGGLPMAVKLIGQKAHIAMHGQMVQGAVPHIILQSLAFKGQEIDLKAKGSLIAEQVKGLLTLNLSDLSALSPMVKGKTAAQVTLDGALKDFAAKIKISSNLSTTAQSGYAIHPSQLDLAATVRHLPTLPQAKLELVGSFDQSPVNIQLQGGMRQKEQDYYLKLQKMNWHSLSASADVTLSQKIPLPIGTIKLDIDKLSDLKKFIGQPINGAVHLDVHTLASVTPKVIVSLNSQLSMPTVKVGKLALSGSIENPLVKPSVNLKLQANAVQAPQVRGNAVVTAIGPMDNLILTVQGNFPALMQSKGSIDTALVLNIIKKTVSVQKLTALVKGETIRLLAPMKAAFGDKIGVDRLRLSVAPVGAPAAVIDVAGTVKPALSVKASVQNITPALVKPFMPDLKAQGVINAQANLSGTIEKPKGTMRVTAQNMKLLSGAAASLPAGQLTALATLAGTTAQVDTHLQLGQKVNVTLQGKAPLQSNGNLALQVNGKADLSIANAILGATGKQVKGIVNLALQISGAPISPMITGNVELTDGSFQDYAQGVIIRNIHAMIVGKKDHIILQSFTADAGKGKMSAHGQVGILQPGIPVDLNFIMDGAQPLRSDLLTATLDSDITIKGMAKTRIDVSGFIHIKHAEINIPRSVPNSVVSIKVIRPGEKDDIKVAYEASGPVIGLNMDIKSTGQMLIRGFGLFTDMGGALHIGGTAQAPLINGGFQMKNGYINLAGTMLNFTKGVVGFNGSGVDRKIDPTLDFEVQKEVDSNTVGLSITGYASSPKIKLTSSPPISQDRILAMLLFGADSSNLSATQMAEVGVALASFGAANVIIDPVGIIRKTLGLDQLSVGSGGSDKSGSSKGASISAGKYLSHGIYVGAKQSTGGAGTQAEVQINITKRLKATATVGTGADSSGFITPDNDPGSSVGLLYQFKY